LLNALAVARVDPVPLRLPDPVLEVRPSRFLTLRQQILIGPVQISVILHDRAIQARALIDWSGRIAWVPGKRRLRWSGSNRLSS
jgi:hypothetical protein